MRAADDRLDVNGTPPARSAALRFVIDSGVRAVVDATIDGLDVRMLVHANAGFVAMLTHATVYRISGRRVSKEVDFGLGHDLELSPSGRGHIQLRVLDVAGARTYDPRVEVFDLPTLNWDGMLGLDWLAPAAANSSLATWAQTSSSPVGVSSTSASERRRRPGWFGRLSRAVVPSAVGFYRQL